MLKRAFDITVSIAGLVLFSPLIVGVGAWVAVKLGRPVLFVQERPGRFGRVFRLYKFRTMLEASGRDGEPLPDAQRLTSFGRFLRSTSLDELPELWNILRGDMSFVGPRPLLVEYLELYTPAQARRHEVRPGLTGWAQIHGRNSLSWDGKFELDLWYVENQSFLLDMRILAKTLWQVLKREGISQEGTETSEKFKGGIG